MNKIRENRIHYKIFAGDYGEEYIVKKEAEAMAKHLKNLGFKVVVKKRNFANPNYDVIYYKPYKKVRA